MYPFGNEALRSPPKFTDTDRYVARVVDHELKMGKVYSPKDGISSKLRIKNDKGADMLYVSEITHLRRQLTSLPEEIREFARTNYQHDQDQKRKELQAFQCIQICHLHRILMKNFMAQGFDPKTYRIGGNDRRTYERFYRVEPSLLMTKPQFITAMRRCFGDEILESENSFGKLFESFDFEGRGKVDWRALLYMLMILLQADMTYLEHLKHAFCLYASQGMLDVKSPDRLSLGIIKEFMCVPLLHAAHKDVREMIDECWLELSEKDHAIREMISECERSFLPGGMDSLLVSYTQYQRLLTETGFAPLCHTYDRPWTFIMEEENFHPILLSYLKGLRKFSRDERECEHFIKSKNTRMLRYACNSWREYVGRRNLVRWRFTVWYMKWKLRALNKGFEKWKKQVLEDRFGMNLQRGARGFLGRSRRDITLSLAHKATTAQSSVRMVLARGYYIRTVGRNAWAATTIQKTYRGYRDRLRTRSILDAYLDRESKMMVRERARWIELRTNRAVLRIQMCYRTHKLYQRLVKRQELRVRVEEYQRSMDAVTLAATVKTKVYRQNLAKFYADRKNDYDNDVNNAKVQAAQLDRIKKKRRTILEEGQAIARQRIEEEMNEKEKELQAVLFQNKWTVIVEDRCEKLIKHQKFLLQSPTSYLSAEEKVERKELQRRIKKQIPVVLRRADDNHIPMEIPEAELDATEEILRNSLEAERELVAEMSRADSQRIADEEKELERLELTKRYSADLQKRNSSVIMIQGCWKMHKCRLALRRKAQEVYRKHWDKKYLEYYYEHSHTRATMWIKPLSLGIADVQCAPGWVAMHDNENHLYFYNPETWEMSWDLPERTTLCSVCQQDFAVARMSSDMVLRCEEHLNEHAFDQLAQGTSAEEIKFKPCNGGICMTSVFALIKEKSWMQHCMDRDKNLRDVVETNEEEIKRRKDEAKAESLQGVGLKGHDGPVYCSQCTTSLASVVCDICTCYYCQPCCDIKHRRPPWSSHPIQELASMTFSGVVDNRLPEMKEGGTGIPARGGTPKKKKRRRRKQPLSADVEGGEGGPDGLGGDQEAAVQLTDDEKQAQRLQRRRERKQQEMDKLAEKKAAAYERFVRELNGGEGIGAMEEGTGGMQGTGLAQGTT